MVDRPEKVVRSRLVDRKKDKIVREAAEKFKRPTYHIEFKLASDSEPEYRQFSYPMQITTSFEWM